MGAGATPVVKARRWRRLGGLFAGLRQQRRQGLGLEALQGAEIGQRQRRALKVAQQRQAGLAFLLLGALALGLFGLLGLLGLSGQGFLGLGLAALLGLGLLLTLASDLAPAHQLLAGQLAVFLAQLTGRLAVQVKARLGLAQRDQIGGAGGVAAEKRRQCRLCEDAGRALVDIGLDAQLQGLGRAAKQRREMLLQQLGTGRR